MHEFEVDIILCDSIAEKIPYSFIKHLYYSRIVSSSLGEMASELSGDRSNLEVGAFQTRFVNSTPQYHFFECGLHGQLIVNGVGITVGVQGKSKGSMKGASGGSHEDSATVVAGSGGVRVGSGISGRSKGPTRGSKGALRGSRGSSRLSVSEAKKDKKIKELEEKLSSLTQQVQELQSSNDSHLQEIDELKSVIEKLRGELKEVKSAIDREKLRGEQIQKEKDQSIVSLERKVNDLEEQMKQYKSDWDTIYLSQIAEEFEKAICAHVLPEVFSKENDAKFKDLLTMLNSGDEKDIPLELPDDKIRDIIKKGQEKWGEVCDHLKLDKEWKGRTEIVTVMTINRSVPNIFRAMALLKTKRNFVAHPKPVVVQEAVEKVDKSVFIEKEWQFKLVKEFISSLPEIIKKTGIELDKSKLKLE